MAGEIRRVLVAGLGNVLLSDDGVGVHAIRALQLAPPTGARLVEIGTALLDALDHLEWAQAVIALDAVVAGKAPGTIYSFYLDPTSGSERASSLRQLGLREALNRLPRPARPSIHVLGVQPASLECGLELSPPVRAALPALVRLARTAATALLPSGGDRGAAQRFPSRLAARFRWW